ncbi:MAG: pyridoxal phosphate-dependent aminotransferase [Bdellovibrionales bacterium]|nr:pyridoxal phosphate-dependent aminotransferase [Bdellovibrionales bacterium]
MPGFSKRAEGTPPSPIRALAPLAREQQEKGKKVWYLNIGQPDLLAPDSFYKALNEFGTQMIHYAPSEGLKSLRVSWANFLNKTLATSLHPDEMIITTGASEALLFTFAACCDPGEEILTFDPTYANYIGISALAGVKLKSLITKFEDNYALPEISEIEKAITKQVKAVLLCSPNNPTGSVYDAETVKSLAELCKQKNVYLIVDESYREIVFDNCQPFSVLSEVPDEDHIVMIDSLSKRFSLCGVRVGCVVTKNKKLLKFIWNMASTRLASPFIAQVACAKMIEETPPEYILDVKNTYQNRRDALLKSVAELPGVNIFKSGGAFYTILDLPVDCAQSFATFLLKDFAFENETVFIAPVSGFYLKPNQGKTQARVAFVLEPNLLVRATKVLDEALKAYNA